TTVQFYLNDSVGMTSIAFIGSDIYIGGHFNISWHDPLFMSATNCPNIMRFDGTYGHIVDTGLNNNVLAMVAMDTNLYVAGSFTTAGEIFSKGIARWDGTTWWSVGNGVVGSGTINALAVMGTNLYAGGTFTNIGGVPAANIAKWDGNTWSALGSGTS